MKKESLIGDLIAMCVFYLQQVELTNLEVEQDLIETCLNKENHRLDQLSMMRVTQEVISVYVRYMRVELNVQHLYFPKFY